MKNGLYVAAKRHVEFSWNSDESHNLNLEGEATIDKHIWGENTQYLDVDTEKIKRKENKAKFYDSIEQFKLIQIKMMRMID